MSDRKRSQYYYSEHAKNCDPDDIWGQVKRTIRGKPVDQSQIDLIVDAVVRGLDLSADDTLLDLCCGNGALTTYFFSKCKGGAGVDISDYLIEIARKRFVKRPTEAFVPQDVIEFVETDPSPERYTKVVCYGSFQYLSKSDAERLLSALRRRFTRLTTVFIGNHPDKNRLREFYSEKDYRAGIEDAPDSPVGIWRTADELLELGKRTGWRACVTRMPAEYYAAHYRYDAVLVKA